ncbi:flavin reductase family protein [Aerophototrophica crusticola]|uniref:Flavin reductase family protein n=1 Tax=Aerophototrophica crusticola TaxID=1709002 RepID=A0A858R6C3_9PROT|nr:flavin reductase family protein [Rhodospirillaceae bacterium B3]
MSIDPRAFRDAMGCFATGICVATAPVPGGRPVAVTVNSFSSVSLEPPLVLFCLDKDSDRLAAFTAAQAFALTVLADAQQDLSMRFARPPFDGLWDGVATESWDTGAPILAGGLAAMDCALHAVHEGGDHLILVGRVLRLESRADGRPLLYFRGQYATL